MSKYSYFNNLWGAQCGRGANRGRPKRTPTAGRIVDPRPPV